MFELAVVGGLSDRGDWCSELGKSRGGGGGQRTFFSLFFSVTSSLPAFAAWRFSCLAVN